MGNGEGAVVPKVARILIADDHALVREGLRIMLSGEEGIEVIAEAKDGRQALTLCRELIPDLVLMDASGQRLLSAVRRTLEGESPLNQELAMRLLRRLARESSSEGGSGGTSREPPEDAPEEAEGEGDEPLTTHPVATRPGAHQAGSGGAAQIQSLTSREVEVLKLLSQGQTNRQIAQNLLFSVSTVKAQVRSILAKLGVSDRTQAAVRAIESRLTTSSID